MTDEFMQEEKPVRVGEIIELGPSEDESVNCCQKCGTKLKRYTTYNIQSQRYHSNVYPVPLRITEVLNDCCSKCGINHTESTVYASFKEYYNNYLDEKVSRTLNKVLCGGEESLLVDNKKDECPSCGSYTTARLSFIFNIMGVDLFGIVKASSCGKCKWHDINFVPITPLEIGQLFFEMDNKTPSDNANYLANFWRQKANAQRI